MSGRATSVRTDDAAILRERQNNARRDVAVVGLRNERDEVLMVETSRLRGWWQPVGGGVDPDDDGPEAAAVREAKEELDLELDVTDLTLIAEAPYDFGVGTVHFYEARVSSTAPLSFNAREILRHQWLPVAQARKLRSFPATASFLDKLM